MSRFLLLYKRVVNSVLVRRDVTPTGDAVMTHFRTLAFGAALALASPAARADDGVRVTDQDRQHWSFRAVVRLAVPEVRDAAWARNPIDRFVLAKLEAKGWRPSAPAEPRALLRRLYLDVIGLPPTPEQQEAFVRSQNPEALDRVADELLASPRHGEKWARHWLDLVRYAETNGYERDAVKPHVWRYRDYVIKSFNADKPFDRFVKEQLAGDELPGANAETLIATGFYRLGPWDDEPADPKEDRFDQLDDMVNTTSQVFLGLTLACARCHDHKFEPLSARDYYRMVAVFNPLRRPQRGRTDLDLPAGTRAEVAAQEARDRTLARLAAATFGPRPFAAAALADDGRRLRAAAPDLPRGYFPFEPSPRPSATHLLLRGQASRPGPEVGPGVPEVLAPRQPEFPPPGEHTSLRRLTLARWVASPDNPLTARVIVNRVWQFHFGEGLVRTPSDFGVLGDRPTHPELLDWLAGWFVDNGWSLKKLHRLILASNAYRMGKRWDARRGAEDPENRFLWRVPYRRLEAEAIRDSVLSAGGQLNPTMYGPSVSPPIPKEALEGHSDPGTIWAASGEREAARRTVYVHTKRSMLVPMLELLDFCDTARTTAKRGVTSVAPQALTLFNGEFVNRQAAHFADRLAREAGDDVDQQVERAYLLALCRPPTATEKAALTQFLRREADGLAAEKSLAAPEARRRVLAQACRVLFNLNEFVYTD